MCKRENFFCFGFNDFKQIPDAYSEALENYFSQLRNESKIKFVTFSWSSCYILLENGDLYASGYAGENSGALRKMITPPESSIVKVSCLGKNVICITENGKCWKRININMWENVTNCFSIPTKLRKSFKFVDIVSSDAQYLFLSNAGIVFNFPMKLEINPVYIIEKVTCGFEHNLCLTTSGTILSWGSGRRGQLGNGELRLVEHPEVITLLDGLKVIDIAAGGWHSAAVTDVGDVYTWGWNCSGQLGTGCKVECDKKQVSETLLAIPSCIKWSMDVEPTARSVSCGTKHTMVILENSSLWGCGWNKYGQVNPSSSEKIIYELSPIILPANITKVKNVHCAAWNTAIICDLS